MHKIFSLIAFFFLSFIIWAIYLANTGGSSIFFELIREIPYGDKLGHFLLFGILTFILIIASKYKHFDLAKKDIYYVSIAVGIFVVGEELSQAFIPSRTLDFLDLLADFLGIVLADALARKTKNRLK